MGNIGGLSKKIGHTKGTFHARMGMIKDIKSKALTEAKEITQIISKRSGRIHGRTIQKRS